MAPSNDTSFRDCELAILRIAVDKAEKREGEKSVSSPEIKNIIGIVEDFLRKTKCICYGGTAINNILPKDDQFYDYDAELPDYDFYSTSALKHAKELADIYCKHGFTEVEAKAGMHYGTYKVFVNYIPIADITALDSGLYTAINRDSIKIDGILYAPPNFLRQSMYLELSRPAGDVSRWEKVLKRLILLNKHYPLKAETCNRRALQRGMDSDIEDEKKLYYLVRDSLINQGTVFIGGYADALYSRYMPKSLRKLVQKVPDFDVLAENPERVATILKENLERDDFKHITIREQKGIGELVSPHYEVLVDKETVAFIYEPNACHSYNTIKLDGRIVKVATIDTLLSFYLAFTYANRPYHDIDRLMCMSQFLFQVQQKNRLAQKGLLRRFSISCYGNQHTLESMRQAKTDAYNRLSGNRNTKEYEEWFLKYNPCEKSKATKSKATKSKATKSKATKSNATKGKTTKSKATRKTKPTRKCKPKRRGKTRKKRKISGSFLSMEI
jgi:hypothetical protein